MLIAKELRVGSMFLGIAGVQTVKSILDFKDRGDWNGKDAQDGYEHLILVNENRNQYKPCEIEGIPLTPEWLERFGFESTNDDGYSTDWRYNGICIVGMVDDFIEDMTGTKLYYIHQLQNLYFALTGQDLQTK